MEIVKMADDVVLRTNRIRQQSGGQVGAMTGQGSRSSQLTGGAEPRALGARSSVTSSVYVADKVMTRSHGDPHA